MKTYIVKTKTKEYNFLTLKEARTFVRSLLNVAEIQGIEETYEVYKQVLAKKKIDEIKSDPKVFGKIFQ